MTKFYKQFFPALWLLLLAGFPVSAQETTVAPSVRTFALNPDATGAAANSVNLFTGDVALPLNLVSLPGHNGLDVNVSISYNSNVQNVVNTWNLEAPAGILGLGWNMDAPKIIVDHKQTGAQDDDVYYLMEGGSSNRLVRTSSGSDAAGLFKLYETKNYQFWRIKYYYNDEKWDITREDGTRYVYGDKNSGRKTLQWLIRWGNWIGNSAQATGQVQMPYTWNLSQIINQWGETMTFEYLHQESSVGSGTLKQTEASYLQQITDVLGRKVQFFYADRDAQFFAEPHTEKAEPDAYQEYYEKKYLDRIEVLRETNDKFLSVHFGYSSINAGTSSAKMLLTSIIQRNSTGGNLPGMQFSYYPSGNTKGFLDTVTYPTAGTVKYAYNSAGATITRSARQSPATIAVAPAGYAEPKVWVAEDYVVVMWRELNAGTHDSAPRTVKLYVYQWVGEWKEQFLQTIGGVSLVGDQYNRDYKEVQVEIQKDFFAVLTRASGTLYHMFVRYKNPAERGHWLNYSNSIDYGDGLATLMSGENFVAIGSKVDDSTRPTRYFTFVGDGWRDELVNRVSGEYFYTGTNNYFISHDKNNNFGSNVQDAVYFSYLSEDKKWVHKMLADNATTVFNSTASNTHWHASNSFAMVLPSDNPEFIYRWDAGYNSFVKDDKDHLNGALFGTLADEAPVYMMANSMVGVYGRIVRFDGLKWYGDNITSTQNSPYGFYFAYGEDVVVRPTLYLSSNYRGGRKVFDPNLLGWQPDVNMDGADAGSDFAYVGIDYYYFGNGYYYRQPNGQWVKKFTYTTLPLATKGGYLRFDVWHSSYPFNITEIRSFKNGEVGSPGSIANRRLLWNNRKFPTNGVGNQTIVSYPNTFSEAENATSLQLNRVINDNLSGSLVDFPVTLITTYDGVQSRHISFDYNLATATYDPSGNVAQYNEVTAINGSNVVTSKPYGSTKTFFYNGLTSTELGVSYLPVDQRWTGMPYETRVFDNNNVLLSWTKTTYGNTVRNINNVDGTKVDFGYYTRVTQTNSFTDGVETVAVQSFDANTGLPTQSSSYDYDSRRGSGTTGTNFTITRYKYFWEQYDPTRSRNILSPVIQTRQLVNNSNSGGEVVIAVSATTWKSWNNVFAPHKTYTWRRTGTADFNFATWSDAGEPAADWTKMSQVDALDAKGNPVQITSR